MITSTGVGSYPASAISPSAVAGSGFASCETQLGPVVARAAETGVTLGWIVARPVSSAPGSSATTPDRFRLPLHHKHPESRPCSVRHTHVYTEGWRSLH